MATDLPLVRFKLIHLRPYLATAVWNLIPVPQEGLGTFAVDKFWRLYYDPNLSWSLDQQVTVLYHEVMHVLRNHAGRAGQRDHMLWNIAGDAEINDDIIGEGKWEFPGTPVTPNAFNEPDGQLAEAYYEKLMQQAQQQLQQLQKQKGHTCGSAADGHARPYEQGPPSKEQPGVGEVQADMIRKHVAEEIKSRGNAPAHLQRWAEQLLTPKVDWRAQLKTLVRQAVAVVCGRDDYSFARASRRTFPDVILPATVSPQPEVAVVLDTSGSISNEQLGQALSELKGVLRAVPSVRVLCVDAAVHSVQKVFSPKNFKVEGGGGTDMGKGIEAAMQLNPKPSVIIVLTDGYTPWPTEPPPAKVIIGLIGKNANDQNVPGWAKKVRIEED
jgi:predicted metal-dependent peptidase